MSLTALGSPLLTEWWPLFGEHAGGDPAPIPVIPTKIVTRPTDVSEDGSGTSWTGMDLLEAGTGTAYTTHNDPPQTSKRLVLASFVGPDDLPATLPEGASVKGVQVRLNLGRLTVSPADNVKLSDLTLHFPGGSSIVIVEEHILLRDPDSPATSILSVGSSRSRFGQSSEQLSSWIGDIDVSFTMTTEDEADFPGVTSAELVYFFRDSQEASSSSRVARLYQMGGHL